MYALAAVATLLVVQAGGAASCPPLDPEEANHEGVADAMPGWTEALRAAELEMQVPSAEVTAWLAYLDGMRAATPLTHLDAVNRYVNRAPFRCEGVAADGTQLDVWVTPATFFREGGDCEDFALAKYLSLRRLGFAVDDLRVVVAFDRVTGSNHAFVAACANGAAYALDNLFRPVISLGALRDYYVLLYAMNERAWWTFPGGVARP